MARTAWGAGLATIAADGSVLDTWFRWLGWGEYGDDDCPTDINGFRAVCEPFNICDYSQDPPDCQEGNVCMFAKACQCSNCCSQLQ